MRAALIFTGHLRDTCDAEGGLAHAAYHVLECQARFAACDVFMHTWDTLDKAPSYALENRSSTGNRISSWACAHKLRDALNLSSIAIESQPPIAPRSGTWENQSLASMRMNVASMAGGVALMRQRAEMTGQSYAAAVRIRADVGSRKMQGRSDFRQQFLDATGWAHVRHRAQLASMGELSDPEAHALVICQRPYEKRVE